MEPLLRNFLYVAVFRKRFYLWWKAFDLLNKTEAYYMGCGAAGDLWRHQQRSPSWPPSWILPRIRNQVKTARNSIFFVLYMINYKISTLHDFSHKVYFYCWRKLKKIYFHAKMAWPPATHDFVSRNDRKWPSLNLSQNLREGWTNSYWKRQVLVFHPLGKKLRKTLGRWHPPTSRPPPPTTPLYVRGLTFW